MNSFFLPEKIGNSLLDVLGIYPVVYLVIEYASPPAWMTPDDEKGDIVLECITSHPIMHTIEWVHDILLYPTGDGVCPIYTLHAIIDQIAKINPSLYLKIMRGIPNVPEEDLVLEEETDEEKKHREKWKYFYNHFLFFLSKSDILKRMLTIIDNDIKSSRMSIMNTFFRNALFNYANNIRKEELADCRKLHSFFYSILSDNPEYPIRTSFLIELSSVLFEKVPDYDDTKEYQHYYWITEQIPNRMKSILDCLVRIMKIPEKENILYRRDNTSALSYLIWEAIKKYSLMHMVVILLEGGKCNMFISFFYIIRSIIGIEKLRKAFLLPLTFLEKMVSPITRTVDVTPSIFCGIMKNIIPFLLNGKKDIIISSGYKNISLVGLTGTKGLNISRKDEKVSSFNTEQKCGKTEVFPSSSSIQRKSRKRNREEPEM